ncbi:MULTISPECIES: hypothetical protein [Bacillus]|nr:MULTISPECIES: hypothetical protein [Bacillus]MDF3254972.1 hypothetical protein [Bacillus velezensis]MDF3267799.1 hypothetical protein [Bacillus velezensis]NRF03110.1 hypothetical protein [Bacillus subtilis]NRG38886.1 hypothetical protein [Bacillus subtilis]WHX51937.1 hypothetical protein QNH30_11900 [Bacillus subtilis]
MKKLVIATFITVTLGLALVSVTDSPQTDRNTTLGKQEIVTVASRGAGS